MYAVIADAKALPQWWPAVYLNVQEREPGETNGIGRSFELTTKGWLPYILLWQLIVRELNPPHGSVIGAAGDFNERGIWRFTPTNDGVAITFDWRLRAGKPPLRFLWPFFKPLFALNHRWAMATGQGSLLRELERRRALIAGTNTNTLPAPPGPTTYQPYVAMATAAAVILIAAIMVRDARER